MGRIYSAAGGQAINANTTRTQLVLTAPSNRLVRLRRVMFSQDGHNAGETVLLEVIRATAAGSGGSSVTPVPLEPQQGAAGSTISSGPTTEPTYDSNAILLQTAVNTAIGRDIVWEDGPIVGPSGIVGIRVNNRTGNTNIGSARCLVEFEEIG